jgi:hypothetical protein
MTILGFKIWGEPETERIRHGQARIGDALHGIADDLEEVRQRNREHMLLDEPAPVKRLKAKT